MPGLQEWIYKLEVGGGIRVVRYFLAFFLFAAAAVVYDLRCFRSFSTEEAMDTAQLARRISEGHGYTTDFIRPASLALARTAGADAIVRPGPGSGPSDLSNAPVYPYLLAGWMKMVPMRYNIVDPRKGSFRVYQPEVMIAVLNQILLLGSVVILFLLARFLFDEPVAWVAASVFAGTEMFWRFSISGLSTNLVVLLLLALTACLAWLERQGRDETAPAPRWAVLGIAVAAGTLLALAFLTRYSCGWLVVPVLAFSILYGGRHWVAVSVTLMVTTMVLSGPWLARNLTASGHLFGTAGFAVRQNTPEAADQTLIRSLRPDELARRAGLKDSSRKLVSNIREIFQNDLPRMGGSWITGFFVAGLIFPFGDPGRTRLRRWVLGSVAVLMMVQALGRTYLTTESPDVNSENLLILMSPLLFLFAAAFFQVLLEQLDLSPPRLQTIAAAGLVAVTTIPFFVACLPPLSSPIAYPPYYAPIIQEVSGWMRPNEMMMSDVPAAVAWYGRRPCTALSEDTGLEFLRLNDEFKSVKAVYLTPRTVDSRLISQMVKDKKSWGNFLLEYLTRNQPPAGFPLRVVAPGFLPDQFFLTDWERWKMQSP